MNIPLRQATADDLPAINRVIEAAVMDWKLPERVKRLSLPSYRYQPLDLDHLQLWLAEDSHGQVLGIAAWEPADPHDTPESCSGLLLHGLYVHPAHQRQGLGGRLLTAAEQAARQLGLQGLLVKAQQDALGFFRARGLRPVPVQDPARHYANRLWKNLS
jgi:GNAT superfamily N-acetyltransferase